MSLIAIRENKILAKISESTVTKALQKHIFINSLCISHVTISIKLSTTVPQREKYAELYGHWVDQSSLTDSLSHVLLLLDQWL